MLTYADVCWRILTYGESTSAYSGSVSDQERALEILLANVLWDVALERLCAMLGTQITCFTGTTVQIMTQKALLGLEVLASGRKILKWAEEARRVEEERYTARASVGGGGGGSRCWGGEADHLQQVVLGLTADDLGVVAVCKQGILEVDTHTHTQTHTQNTHTNTYRCPHTTIYVSLYCYACVLMLLWRCVTYADVC
jgi:hypothetical protein